MNRTAFLALWSHWRRQPLQLLVLVLGLSLATGLWSAVQAINGQARASYASAAAQLAGNQLDRLTSPSGRIPLETYAELRRAGWQLSPVLTGRLRLGDARLRLIGVDVLSYPVIPSTGGGEIAPDEILTPPGRLLASAETRDDLPEDADLPPLVLAPNLPPGTAFTDIATAARLLNRPSELSYLLILPDQPMGLPSLQEIAPDLTRQPPSNQADAAQLTDSFHLNLTAFGLLSFAVGLFIVNGTVGLAFEQRRPLMRTLRALGLPRRNLTALVMGELLALALVAGTLGLVLGYLIAAALLPDVAATLRGLYGAPVAGGLTLRPLWVASGLGMALLGTAIAGAQGVWRLTHMPLLASAGLVGWADAAQKSARIMALCGVALIVAGVLAAFLLPGLIGGFALLAGLLMGAALTLPILLHTALALLSRTSRAPASVWIWADLRAQLPGLSLALMALLLALATNIGVGTMVSSFRLTFTGWLDQRLMSELYLTARDDAQGAAIAEWLAPRADAVLPIRAAEITLAGQPAQLYGVADHATYRDHWPLVAQTPDLWDRLARGETVIINEQLARSADIWPGDTIDLGNWQIEVGGVYSDYGNPAPEAIAGLAPLLNRYPDIENRRFGIRIAPDKADALAQELRATFDLPDGAITDQAAVKSLSLDIFEKTFVVTAALNVLTLGVASFAILTSLLTLWNKRLPHLAPVWALGMTRARLARLEVLRSVALAGLTALLALPLGLILAWVLLAVINVQAFGWRLPMHLFPLDWLWLFLLALLAGAAAAAIPARRLHRLPPAALLRIFADER
ncbi:ABC transporter permease [Heliomarina baculiformis]|uniref:ABC transporter permease n=1 Tax=Heliomarina baculiformis TaxID=2872036 RepID=UPI001EE21214|nr:FtsX-like permease family protein [Heliomarina baculiformis]